MLALLQPDTPEQWATAQAMVDEYALHLGIDLSFQNFAHERLTLEEEYGSPAGAFLLAQSDSAWIGCGAFRPLVDSTCEMKRLYVVPSMQGRGVGRAIAEALVTRARAAGYRRMRLDTLSSMRRRNVSICPWVLSPSTAIDSIPCQARRSGNSHCNVDTLWRQFQH